MSVREIRGSAADLDLFLKVTRDLVGEECWAAYVPNGEFLQLDIGERVRYRDDVADAEVGSWGIVIHTDNWYVEDRRRCEGRRVAGVEARLDAIRGIITGVSASPQNLTLTVTFEADRALVVPPGEISSAYGYWEIFTPNNMIFQGGPRYMWRYRVNEV